MFDEPSSYLDVKQRLKAAATIRNILQGEEGGECPDTSRRMQQVVASEARSLHSLHSLLQYNSTVRTPAFSPEKSCCEKKKRKQVPDFLSVAAGGWMRY